MENLTDLDFTSKAWESLYDVVDNRYFQDQDAGLIYEALETRLRLIPFGEYLKRYIYQKSGLTMPFDEVPLNTYRQIIVDAFADNNTPPSFEPTTAKLSALTKNWLTQQTVKRKVVFLLGFGLSMSAEDVDEFLRKALREQGINAKSPFEVICWYCLKNGFNYLKFSKLWEIYEQTPPNALDMGLLYEDMTIGMRDQMTSLHSDAALIRFAARLKTPDNGTLLSVSARRRFEELYEKGRALIAALYNQTEREQSEKNLAAYREQLLRNERLADSEIQERLARRRGESRVWRADEITESDFEHIICSAIPLDRFGNLTPSRASSLNAQFSGKRFSRQHIHDVLTGKSEVNRFDLITLNFFVFSQTLDDYPNIKTRYTAFIDSTNRILESCFLERLYIANPYECFVLMCILSEDPLGTYADVWEMSY